MKICCLKNSENVFVTSYVHVLSEQILIWYMVLFTKNDFSVYLYTNWAHSNANQTYAKKKYHCRGQYKSTNRKFPFIYRSSHCIRSTAEGFIAKKFHQQPSCLPTWFCGIYTWIFVYIWQSPVFQLLLHRQGRKIKKG